MSARVKYRFHLVAADGRTCADCGRKLADGFGDKLDTRFWAVQEFYDKRELDEPILVVSQRSPDTLARQAGYITAGRSRTLEFRSPRCGPRDGAKRPADGAALV